MTAALNIEITLPEKAICCCLGPQKLAHNSKSAPSHLVHIAPLHRRVRKPEYDDCLHNQKGNEKRIGKDVAVSLLS